MKYTIFLSALIGLAGAKGGEKKNKCSEEQARRCSTDRNVVEFCIQGSWNGVEWCKSEASKHGPAIDKGVCTEEPTVACRKPDSPVAVDFDPRPAVMTISGASSATAAPTGVITLELTPGVAPTNIPANLPVFGTPPAPVAVPSWVAEPAW